MAARKVAGIVKIFPMAGKSNFLESDLSHSKIGIIKLKESVSIHSSDSEHPNISKGQCKSVISQCGNVDFSGFLLTFPLL